MHVEKRKASRSNSVLLIFTGKEHLEIQKALTMNKIGNEVSIQYSKRKFCSCANMLGVHCNPFRVSKC
jgi:hypothetical protein